MSNIHEQFTKWGKTQRQTPLRNDALKSQVLARAASMPPARTTIRWGGWISFAFAGLAVLTLFIQPISRVSETIPMAREESSGMNLIESTTTKSLTPQRDAYYYPPYQDGTPITDDREFLKTTYHAEIRTRQPDEKAERLQLAIRGLGGRVDSLNISEKYGRITFALPEDKFQQLRNEVKALTRGRLIIENISSNNLLPQKQQIESQPQTHERDAIDRKFMANVDTVTGTISFRWISAWEMIELYAGPYWLPIVFGIAAIIAYWSNRKTKKGLLV